MSSFFAYCPGIDSQWSAPPWVWSIIANAANIKGGGSTNNPAYTMASFIQWYPQFASVVPEPVITNFISMANSAVDFARWGSDWQFGMANFIAHYLTKYVQVVGNGSQTAPSVLGGAQPIGLEASMGVGDVSVSQDYSYMLGDLEGWGDFTSTAYGIMYADRARLYAAAGTMVG